MRESKPSARSCAPAAILAAALTCALSCTGSAPVPAPPRRLNARPASVVLISVEGMRPDAYGSAGETPSMPGLAARAQRGVRADAVETVVPAVLYPTHASLVTGRHPDRHGVVADRRLGERGSRRTPYWHASMVRGASLWQAVASSGRPVVSLAWPSTVGAAVDGLVPDLVPLRRGETWLGVLQGAATPALHRSLSEKIPDAAAWPSASVRDSALVELACEVLGNDPAPALLLLRLSATGDALERSGPDSTAARAAFAAADAQIEELVACAGTGGRSDRAAFVIVGDRAILSVHTEVEPNLALAEAHLLGTDPRSETGIGVWRAYARASGSGALVYARNEAAAVEARQALLAQADRTGAFRVLPASVLAELRGDPQAWFGLQAEPGYVFGMRAQPPALRASPQLGAAGAAPGPESSVGFVAFGRGLRPGVRVPLMHQVDVAPTVAALLGIFLERADGRVLVGVLAFDPGRVSATRGGRE